MKYLLVIILVNLFFAATVTAAGDPLVIRDGKLMLSAISEGRNDDVQRLLERSPYIGPNGFQDESGNLRSFIVAAVRAENEGAVDIILEAGVDPSLPHNTANLFNGLSVRSERNPETAIRILGKLLDHRFMPDSISLFSMISGSSSGFKEGKVAEHQYRRYLELLASHSLQIHFDNKLDWYSSVWSIFSPRAAWSWEISKKLVDINELDRYGNNVVAVLTPAFCFDKCREGSPERKKLIEFILTKTCFSHALLDQSNKFGFSAYALVNQGLLSNFDYCRPLTSPLQGQAEILSVFNNSKREGLSCLLDDVKNVQRVLPDMHLSKQCNGTICRCLK